MADPFQEIDALLAGPGAGRSAALAAITVCVLAAGVSGLAAVAPAALAQARQPADPATEAQTREEKTLEEKAGEEKTGQPVVYRLGDLTVGDVWAHQSTKRNGAAYLRIDNAGESADALIDASTPLSKRVELRGPVPGGGTWDTGRVDAIPAPAGKATELTAAASHLRLVGLRDILSVGGTVRITLTFEQAGAITVKARVLSANDASAIIEKIMPLKAGSPPQSAPDATPAERQ